MLHHRARKDVHLSCDPQVMGATLSMTSDSNWYKVLQAGDTEADIKKKLNGMKFGISRRTWQVVEESEEARALNIPGVGSGSGLYGTQGGAESRASLLSTAKGVDPWERGGV